MENISYSLLIPDKWQNELIAIKERATRDAWAIGDITNVLKDYHKEVKTGVLAKDIWSAVGAFVGKSARTVRFYASMAAIFMSNIRAKYEVLSHDHFRLASQYIEPEKVLLYAVSRVDDYGRPATVDDCYQEFFVPEDKLYSGEEPREATIIEKNPIVTMIIDPTLDVIGRIIGVLSKLSEKFYNEGNVSIADRLALIAGELLAVQHDLRTEEL